jgi:hypothetical protein
MNQRMIPGALALALLLVPLAHAADRPPAHAAGVPAAAGAPGQPQATGSIAGTVEIPQRPARRVASRYPAGRGGQAHAVQEIPAVVYVLDVQGARPPARPPVMTQRDTAFDPAVLVVPVGTTVAFPNEDPFFHNVFSYSPAARFDLARYPRGQSKSVTFAEPGVVKVYCEVHDFMRAVVIVSPTPLHAVVAPDGSFRIDGVPAGRRALAVWHADQGERTAWVDVPAGGVAQITLRLD